MKKIITQKNGKFWTAWLDKCGIFANGKTRDEAVLNLGEKIGKENVSSTVIIREVNKANHDCHYTEASRPHCVVCGRLLGGF